MNEMRMDELIGGAAPRPTSDAGKTSYEEIAALSGRNDVLIIRYDGRQCHD